ncbi:MAG: hypothetical protein AAF528_00785 [Cyanobacteria bacterium P01_C01_bin.121]
MDYPEGIALQPLGRQYQTAVLAEETLTLELYPLELATMQLSGQMGDGQSYRAHSVVRLTANSVVIAIKSVRVKVL